MGKRLAMAEMFLWAAAGGFALFGYTTARRLGLLDHVPRDPKARVAAYSSGILMVLKDQLIGSQVTHWEDQRVEYIKRGAASALWVEDGAVHCLYGKEQESFPIGDRGHLAIAMQGDEMLVKIFAAESGGAEHDTQVSIRVLLPRSA